MNGIDALSSENQGKNHLPLLSQSPVEPRPLIPLKDAEADPTSEKGMRQCSQLTARENEVIRCFSYGLLYKETADRLKISYSAVHKHQHNAFRKLKAANRSEAVRKWWDMGCR
jgi:DNA-binding CsgD family transcriptional regulator